jgi:hypothetical protein
MIFSSSGTGVEEAKSPGYLADGFFSIMNRFTVYMSGVGEALGMSR